MMAFIRVIALALVLAASSAWSHPFESARDQYEAREDKPQPQLLTEATDHRPEVYMSHHSDLIKKSTNSSKQLVAPDLQVGCGDGLIHESQKKSEVEKNPPPKKRVSRRKRSYTPWSNQLTYNAPYESISVWRPPVYQLSRPYYIPVFGVPGRIPIYFPPQPLYINPGVPKDNPKKPFNGPEYLPPVEPTTSSTTMEIGNRFQDERPIWDLTDNKSTQRPNRRPTQRPSATTSMVPTRRPRPPGVPRDRPLIHNPTDPEGASNVDAGINEIFTTSAPTTAYIPPPAQTVQRPRPNEPSRCVWAIISCCSSSGQISYQCFEQRGCPGAFWDNSPCESEFAQAAINAALSYYNK